MRYLFGDSTESDLEFDYLAFLREVIDCAVVMAECEVTLGVTVEDRRTRELETAAVIAAVDDLGRRASQLVGPVASEQASAPVGRCAAAIAAAIREAVERESQQARAALAAECDEMDRQDQRQRERARTVLEKLLRAHDLPGAHKELEVAWTAAGVKATMRERTSFGVEAVVALDIPASSIFGIDLRVDRIADGVEVRTHETGGWLKKSDKVVAHKLGRYQVTGVQVGGDATTVRLRMTPEPSAPGFVITARRGGELHVEPTGAEPGREVAIDERDVARLRLLAERLETAVRALADNRTGLVSVEIDGAPIAQHAHPRVLAERLIAAVAPTVQQIASHSRSPGELVLRRPLGDNRREEIFVSTADLRKRLDGLPSAAREVFAPLQLGGEPAKPAVDEPRPPARPPAEVKAPAPAAEVKAPPPAAEVKAPPPAVEVKAPPPAAERPVPVADHRFDSESDTRPDIRHPGRIGPPPAPKSDARSGPSRLAPLASIADVRRATPPTASRGESPVIVDASLFDDTDSPFPASRPDRPATDRPASAAPRTVDKALEIAAEASRKRGDDSALGDAIDRALDEAEGPPSSK
ncbi:MAG: hypothetical protein E6J90_08755 [Deltaproteobacteria bacterium]|nr:MAG: hypothetical protein E6J91_47665 [Deltaproteobacteria bacterium]TMQ24219.1 MAG: hypothetical protein E6J90_08755 [Deltaproteobacteria bacterium]